ncbi:MAG: hypothetical protein KDB68_00090 [Planctomycetes bacterium]|nr:hypothetical protein [Planctomycetota bacterium]
MAGPQPNPQPPANPQQPYGTQNAPPQFAPRMPRREGSTAPKVWGIILLILGGLGLITLIMNVATLMGGGMTASSFSFNMTPEAKAELDRVAQTVTDSAMTRWTFWLNSALEVVIACVSVVAGYLLVIRPKASGRKMSVARALIVLLALPIYGYESMTAVAQSTEMVAKLQNIQIKDALAQQEKTNPSKNKVEKERREREVTQMIEGMQPLMRGAGYGAVVLTIMGIMIINGILLFSMTRPKVKDYMDHVGEETAGAIPGFDPSMGLMGPPPGATPPAAAQPQPPPDQPS